MATLASLSVVATFLMTIVGYIARLWFNHRKLLERVEALEKQKYLTTLEHDRVQSLCRTDIYKDIAALEGAITRVELRLDKSEEQRDKAREEDQRWKESLAKDVSEISAILKNEIYHQRLGYNLKTYKGP